MTWAANTATNEEIAEHAGGYRTPEYYAFTKMRNDYFLDLFPDNSTPEALERLTALPAYDDVEAWSRFFHDGDPIVMRDEAFLLAEELEMTNPNLSFEEKMKKISEWMFYDKDDGRPFDWNADINGYTYDCTTTSEGYVTVFRIAGIPAISVSMQIVGFEGHEEPFYYDGNTWRNISSGLETFHDYFSDAAIAIVAGGINSGKDTYMLWYNDYILDIDESWVGPSAEYFMFDLFQQPFAYPNRKLTRGEVAKLICHYLNTVPMRNEQVFFDVPVSHNYAPYIWVMNKLGIMMGDGNGAFHPDSELSMQEFAVMAMRMLEYGGEKTVESKLRQIQEIENDPENWPLNSEYTRSVLTRLKEEADWQAQLAKYSYNDPLVFADNDEIASWAKPAVDEFSKLGVLQGDSFGSGSRLNPTEVLSKTRFLFFLFKLDQKSLLAVNRKLIF
jgi:hypothetical protein